MPYERAQRVALITRIFFLFNTRFLEPKPSLRKNNTKKSPLSDERFHRKNSQRLKRKNVRRVRRRADQKLLRRGTRERGLGRAEEKVMI